MVGMMNLLLESNERLMTGNAFKDCYTIRKCIAIGIVSGALAVSFRVNSSLAVWAVD
jgi:hypothetical protein